MNAIEFLKLLPFADKQNDNVMVVGLHGIGKTAIGKQYAKLQNYHMELLSLSNVELGDLIGSQYVDNNNDMRYTKPKWLRNIWENAENGIRSVLFLDEFNRPSSKEVLDTALPLVLDGKLHEHSLPEGEMRPFIISAINPFVGDSPYTVVELDPALLDRFTVVHLEADVPSFTKYGRENEMHETVLSFVEQNPQFLHYTPKDDSEAKSEVDVIGSTPRSLERVSDYLIEYEKNTDDLDYAIFTSIIIGRLGLHVGHQLLTHYKNTKVISYDDIHKVIEKSLAKNKKHKTLDHAKVLEEFYEAESVDDARLISICDIMIDKCYKKEVDLKYFHIFLYSLKKEVRIGRLMHFKNSGDTQELWFNLSELDSELDYELFRIEESLKRPTKS